MTFKPMFRRVSICVAIPLALVSWTACDGLDHTRYMYVCKDAADVYVEYPTEDTAVLYFEGYKHHLRLEPKVERVRYRGKYYRWTVDAEREQASLEVSDASSQPSEAITRCERAP